MAINRERLKQFQKELNRILEQLDATERVRTAETRIAAALRRTDIDAQNTEQLRRILREILDDNVNPIVDDVLQRYETTADLIDSLYSDDLGINIQRDWQRLRAIETTTAQEWGQYKERTIRNLTEVTREELLDGATGRQLQRRIVNEMEGKAVRHAQAIAETQVNTYSRAVKDEQAQRAGVDIFEYVGPVRSVTRPFCRALQGTSHTRAHIQRMRNGNREPVIINCGGWRCVHAWEPDPFADSADDGTFHTPDPGVVIRTTPVGLGRYQVAKELNRLAR